MTLRKQILTVGSIVAALSVSVTATYKTTTWVVGLLDARYLPAAHAADIKSIQSDLLQLRREGLAKEQRDLEREGRSRALSNTEHDRLDYLKRELRKIDQRIRKLDDPGG